MDELITLPCGTRIDIIIFPGPRYLDTVRINADDVCKDGTFEADCPECGVTLQPEDVTITMRRDSLDPLIKLLQECKEAMDE